MGEKKKGGIVSIQSLFDVYKKRLKAPQGTVIKATIEILNDLFHISLEKKNISYSVATKTLSIHASGMIKTEILLRKEEILTHLKGRIGEQGAPQEII